MVKVTVTVLPTGKFPPLCFKMMYKLPSTTLLLNFTELKSLSTEMIVELNPTKIAIYPIGMHWSPFIMIGKVDPPTGIK